MNKRYIINIRKNIIIFIFALCTFLSMISMKNVLVYANADDNIVALTNISQEINIERNETKTIIESIRDINKERDYEKMD